MNRNKKRLNLEIFLLACCDDCDKIYINIRNEKQNERGGRGKKTKYKNKTKGNAFTAVDKGLPVTQA